MRRTLTPFSPVVSCMESADKPYDGFFRSVFASPQLAWELTRTVAPGLASGFTARQVHVESESPVDPEFRRYHTDLLIRLTRRKTDTYVYILYEHKSYRYRWVTGQVLRYMATIWQQLVTEHEQHQDDVLPEILPLVLYAELIENGTDSPHVPHYRPVFVDLTEIPDEQITASLRAVLGLVALKYSRLELEQAAVDRLTELLHRGEADPAARHLARVVQRIYVQVKSSEEMDGLVAAASRLGYYEVEGGYMTYAQELLEKGVEKGSLESRRETLARQLDRKFGLTDAERERISACDDQAELDAALDEFALAETKAQVLAKLP